MQHMWIYYFVLLWTFVLPNLIKRGDFQDYFSCPFDQCAIVDSSDSIWFTRDDIGSTNQILIKKIFFKTNAGALLLNNKKVDLCQTVQLVLGTQYSLQLEVLVPDQYLYASLLVLVNLQGVFQMITPDNLKEYSVIIYFIPAVNQNQICFYDQYPRLGSEDPMLVDNVMLEEVIGNVTAASNWTVITTSNSTANTTSNSTANTTSNSTANTTSNSTVNTTQSNQTSEFISDQFDIYFECQVYGVKQMAVFQSKRPNKRQIIDLFFDNYAIVWKATNKTITNQVFYYKNNETKIGSARILESEQLWGVRLYPHETIPLNQILFIKTSGNQSINFKITVEHQNLLYESLSETESEVVESIGRIQSIAIPQLLKVSLDVRSVVGSLFLLYFLNFWNLGLMYIFLQIETYPLFMKEIYHDLLKLFWEDVNIIDSLASIFKINTESLTLSIEDSSIRELMQKNKRSKANQQFSWFGSYGVSSKVSNSLSENLWLLGIACVRLAIFKILATMYKYLTAKSKKINYLQLLVAELIGMAPLLVISSLVCITQPALNGIEKIHKFSQIMILFCCIFLIGVFPLFSIQKGTMENRSKSQIRDKVTQENEQGNLEVLICKKEKSEKSKHQVRNNKKMQETRNHKKKFNKKQRKQETPTKYSKQESTKKHQQLNLKKQSKSIKKHAIKNKNGQKPETKGDIQGSLNQVKATNSYFRRNLELILILFIPLLVFLAHIQAFLAIILVLLIARAYILIKTFNNNNRTDKILSLSMIFVWYVHHGTFLCFYVFSKFYDFQQYLELYNLLGIVSIITIYAGALFELIGTIFQIAKGVFDIIIEICESQKIEPTSTTVNRQVSKQREIQYNQDQCQSEQDYDANYSNVWYIPAKLVGSKKAENKKSRKKEISREKEKSREKKKG